MAKAKRGDGDYAGWPEEDLIEELHRLDEQKQAIRQQMLSVHVAIEGARAREAVLNMSPAQREAMVLAVQGIESEEASG